MGNAGKRENDVSIAEEVPGQESTLLLEATCHCAPRLHRGLQPLMFHLGQTSFAMDTLYTLLRSADRRHSLPFQPDAARDIADCKQAYIQAEAQENPLLREILAGGTVTIDDIEALDRHGFLQGPATFFRVHEILRKNRAGDQAVRIGSEQFSHDEAVALFGRCIPNVWLRHVPWHSLAHYRLSLPLAWGSSLLVSHLVARGSTEGGFLDGTILYYMGIGTTTAAVVYSTLRSSRRLNQPAPWNSALYLDLNIDLFRRRSPALAAARKDFLPRQTPWKTPDFYYALARRIEQAGFDEELSRRLPSASAGAQAGPTGSGATVPPFTPGTASG